MPEPAPPREQAATAAAPAVDLRVLQANERTLLAWVRTSLALMAFGFLMARLGLWLRELAPAGAREVFPAWLGPAFVLLGTASNAGASLRYLRIRRAILEGQEAPLGHALVLFLAFSLVVLGGVVVAYLLTRR